MILTCKVLTSNIGAPVDNDEIDEDDNSESPPTKEELEKEKMNQQAKTQRKKAGLPELELDSLPSSLAIKMTTLS